MHNLNLYNYYDKSLADINKKYIDSKTVSVKEPSKTGKLKKVALIFMLIFLVAVSVGLYMGYKYYYDQLETTKTEINPMYPDLRSSEEKLGYVRVQIFEFADEVLPQTVPEKKEPETPKPVALEKPQSRPDAYEETKKVLEAIPVPKSNPPVVKESVVAAKTVPPLPVAPKTVVADADKRYSILFEDINQKEYDTVQKSAVKLGLTPNIVNSQNRDRIVWRVYRVEPTAKLEIGGKKVELLKDFNTKEDALNFAKENNLQSVIRSEDIIDRSYTLRLCCTKLDNAKTVAESSNIRNKVIKIIREK